MYVYVYAHKVKLKCLFEGKEKEFQALKDEIRALHVSGIEKRDHI